MNSEDLQLTGEMYPLQPILMVMKRNDYYDMITLLKDYIKHLEVSICIGIFNLDNKQWLTGVTQLVTFYKQKHDLDDKLQKAVGIVLLLFNDIQVKDLPQDLQLVTCLRTTITAFLDKRQCVALQEKLQQVHADRLAVLTSKGKVLLCNYIEI